jgi:hypothetical protein
VPLPISLVGASIVSLNSRPRSRSDRDELARILEERAGRISRCSQALGWLDEQREAVHERTIPIVHAVWDRVDAGNEARSVYHERLSLGEENPNDAPANREDRVAIELIAQRDSPVDLPAALREIIRFDATTAAARNGVEALAQLRLRLHGQCRRLERLAPVGKPVSAWGAHERRLLTASARIAGSAVALARLPAVGPDGGVDRRFAAALRRV